MLFPWDSGDKSAVSGTGYGLAGGLEALGVEVVRIQGRPPPQLLGMLGRGTGARWRLTDGDCEDTWRWGIESTMARNAYANLGLLCDRPVNGIVQLASDFLVHRPNAPLVTYDDMTIRQAVDVGYRQWRLARRDLRWRIERQGAAYRMAAACCTRSAWTARSIPSDYGIEAVKAKVVGVGRNRDVDPQPERSWDTPTFLLVASDWERKNGQRVLTAFAAIHERHPDARLHVVGHHPRIEAPGVEAQGHLGLSDEGEKARLNALFAEATCFVMPSLHEPLGITYAEAGAAGVPSIGTLRGGAREIIGPGGMVVDPLDGGQLIDAMEWFCDPEHAQAVGAQAVAHAQLYTWPRVAKRILNALGQLSPEEDPEAAFLAGPN